MEDKKAVYDTDCHCNTSECFCLSHSDQMDEYEAQKEPLILLENPKCDCNDPKIAIRLNSEIKKFLESRFRSKKFLRKIFGEKIACISTGVLIKTKIALSCNPSLDEFKQTNLNQKRTRRKRVRRLKRLP